MFVTALFEGMGDVRATEVVVFTGGVEIGLAAGFKDPQEL